MHTSTHLSRRSSADGDANREGSPNTQAKRGYSRDKRPDCKQVVVGLVLDRDGFPKAHEVFDGNAQDRTTVDRMLDVLEQCTGKKPGGTVIVDRGMACAENLTQIRQRDMHYIVAGRGSRSVTSGWTRWRATTGGRT